MSNDKRALYTIWPLDHLYSGKSLWGETGWQSSGQFVYVGERVTIIHSALVEPPSKNSKDALMLAITSYTPRCEKNILPKNCSVRLCGWWQILKLVVIRCSLVCFVGGKGGVATSADCPNWENRESSCQSIFCGAIRWQYSGQSVYGGKRGWQSSGQCLCSCEGKWRSGNCSL